MTKKRSPAGDEPAAPLVASSDPDSPATSPVSAKALAHLIGRADHDLRSPLNTIVGWAHLLARDASDPARVRHAAELIGRNARTMATLLEDLLDLSRVVLGERTLVATAVSLRQLVMELIEQERTHAAMCKVQIDVVGADTDPIVLMDRGRLRRPLAKLLEQAVTSATPDTRLQVCIGIDDAHGRLTLRSERPRDGQRLADLPSAITLALLLSRQPGASVHAEEGASNTVVLQLPRQAAPHASHDGGAGRHLTH